MPMRLEGHADADWAGDVDTRQSTTSTLITYGGGPISWRSTKQPSIALSSCEAELITTCEATKTVLWMQSLLRDLDLPNSCATIITLNDRHEPGDKEDHNMPVDPIPHVFNDNQGAIKVAKTKGSTKRSKHVDTKYHYIKTKIVDKSVALNYTATKDMKADILTKPLPRLKYAHALHLLGMHITPPSD
jgi:hypothetical protein